MADNGPVYHGGVEFCSPCTSMPRRLMKPLIRVAAFQKLSDLLSLGIKEPEIGRGISPDAEPESLVCRSGEDGWWGGLRHAEQTLAHVWFVKIFLIPSIHRERLNHGENNATAVFPLCVSGRILYARLTALISWNQISFKNGINAFLIDFLNTKRKKKTSQQASSQCLEFFFFFTGVSLHCRWL